MIETQQLSQSAGIDLVTLVAFPHGGILSRIAHHQFRHVRFQQVVQPGGRGSFFKRDLQVAAQPIDKLQIMLAFVSMTHSITIFPAEFITAIEMLSLCTSMPIYLVLVIKGCSFLEGLRQAPKPYSKRGALLYCVA